MEDIDLTIDKIASQLYATTGDMYKTDCIFLPVFPELSEPSEAIKDISGIIELFGWTCGEDEVEGLPSPRTTYEIEKINNYPVNIESILVKVLKSESLNT